MQQRIDVKEVAPNAYAAMLGLQVYVNKSGLEHALLELIRIDIWLPRNHMQVGALARAPSSACRMKYRGSDGPKSCGT
jgi:hypothetical protein